MIAPCAWRWRRGLRRLAVAAPLRRRQHGVSVRLLLKHVAPVPHALGAAPHPIEDAAAPSAAVIALATVRSHTLRPCGDRRIGRIEPPARVVQEVEDQRVQHLQGAMPHGSAVITLRLVCRSKSRARCHSFTAAFFGIGWNLISFVRAVRPDRPGGIGLRACTQVSRAGRVATGHKLRIRLLLSGCSTRREGAGNRHKAAR